MSEIKIKLYTSNNSRLTKSSGCMITKSNSHYQFEENSFTPIMDWEIVKRSEFKKLTTKKSNLNDVSLIKLPTKIKTKLESLNLNNCNYYKDINLIENTKRFNDIKKELIDYLNSISINQELVISHNIYFGNSNLINNTYNHLTNKYIGFHLDSWEGELLKNRMNSKNRICINLGRESRFIMFYNISIISMLKSLDISLEDENIDINDIYKKYIEIFPDTPIYRLEIKPFEAYIAPTEYIIHDGSSFGTSSPDINLVFRGKFIYSKKSILTRIFKTTTKKM